MLVKININYIFCWLHNTFYSLYCHYKPTFYHSFLNKSSIKTTINNKSCMHVNSISDKLIETKLLLETTTQNTFSFWSCVEYQIKDT